MENGPFTDGLPFNSMVIFHGYVKWPDGILKTHTHTHPDSGHEITWDHTIRLFDIDGIINGDGLPRKNGRSRYRPSTIHQPSMKTT